MTNRRRRARVARWTGAFFWVAARVAYAEAPPPGEPFAIESAALVPLDDESSVAIRGVHGRITVVTLEARELRVVSRRPGPQGAELPVGLWRVGNTFVVSAPPGDDGGERQLQVEVPATFGITVEVDESDVSIQAPGGSVNLRGKNLRAVVAGSSGSLYVELDGGTLTIADATDATVRLKGTTAKIAEVSGNVNVHATGGSVSVGVIRGSTDLDCDETKLVVDGPLGSIRIKARKGDATVMGFKAGAELELSGTPLHLKEGKGDVTVISDAAVDFLSMVASLHFDMYGGSLRGKGNDGILEVRTRNTEVNVETIEQGMRIQGDGLRAHIEDVGDELYIETSISDVVVDRAGSVVLLLDRGSATVQRAAGSVQANVVGGDVHIVDGSGPVTLELDRGDATVSWASFPGDKDSKLVNKSGNITVRFPTSGACHVEATTKYGRIDSEVPSIRVSDDLTEAKGPVNGGSRPIIQIVASGDIHLQSVAKPHEEN